MERSASERERRSTAGRWAGGCWATVIGVNRSRAWLSSTTLTPGSPSTPSERPSVLSAISCLTRCERKPADGGDAVRLDRGVGGRDVRVDAGRRAGDRIDRHLRRGQAAVEWPLELQVGGEALGERVAGVLAVRARGS